MQVPNELVGNIAILQKKKGLLTGRLLMELVGPFNQLKWIKNMILLLLMNDAADFPLNAFDAFY